MPRTTMGDVNVNVSVQYRDTLGRIHSYAKSPFTSSDIANIKQELISNIRNRGSGSDAGIPRNSSLIGTLFTGTKSRPPYHTYPSPTKGELENMSYVNKTSDTLLSLGSSSQHASVLETGRKEIRAAKGSALSFMGYYPNKKILLNILRARIRIPQRLNVAQRKSRMTENLISNEVVVEQLQEAYGAQAFGSKAYREKGRMTSKERAVYQDPDRYARSLGIEPTSRRYKDKTGKTYEYGIFTVLAKRVRAVQPYGVFSKTALWAKKTMIDRVRKRIVKLSGKSGTKVIQWQ